MGMLRAEDTGGSAGRALLVGGGRLSDLALQRSLLLGAQDVSDVVRGACSAAGCVWGGHMAVVRRASRRVHCSWVEGGVLGEVVAGPVTVHGGRVPVHPGAGRRLVVRQRVLRMPALSAHCAERRWHWSCLVKLHIRSFEVC